jgi:hypothetical protein
MRTEKQSIVLLLVLNIIICFGFFYPVLGNFNSMMLAGGGDGIKNYFTYLHFIEYGKGTQFTGMNYPFGENMVFTDNMPALAWSVSKLKVWFPSILDYGLAIMHSTFIISYFLASFFVYRILSGFNVKGWWAVVSAIFIAYFSPQFLRLGGHFSLSFSCFLPMLIYWVMQYERTKAKRYLFYLFLCTTLFTFLHVYYLAFALVLVAAYAFSYFVSHSGKMLKKAVYLVPILLSVVAAMAVLKLYLKFSDPVRDRPKFPIDYLGYGVKGEDILTSDFNFIGANVFRFLFGTASSGSEGYTYLGLVTILTSLFLAYRVIRSIVIRVRRKYRLPTHPVRAYRVWLITALVVLLFSMGVPFVWGMDFLIDYFSTFRQFRTIGRFSWIFYYLMMIYAAIVLYRSFIAVQVKFSSWQRIALPALVLVIYLIELNGYAQHLHKIEKEATQNYKAFYAVGEISWAEWLMENGGNKPEQFQGVIGLPYFLIGSEKLGIQNVDYSPVMFFGSQIARETGLGMTDAMMSRTSWSQSFAQVRLYDGPFTPKEEITAHFDKRPFLLLVNDHFILTPGEYHLLEKARFIGNRYRMDVYELDIDDMLKREAVYTDSVKQRVLQLPQQEGLLNDSLSFRYANHFENTPSNDPFAGKGAYTATREDKQLIADIPVTHLTPDTSFILSAWMHCYDDSPNMPYLMYEQYDAGGKLILEGDALTGHSNYISRLWFKAERVITIKPDAASIRVYAKGGIKNYSALDELLIVPVKSIYHYRASDRILMLNNRPLTIR